MSDKENLIARMTAQSMNALNELPQKTVDTLYDALELISNQSAHICELSESLQRYEDGYQGACYACEKVGELNVKLQAENAERIKALEEAIDVNRGNATAMHTALVELHPRRLRR